MRRWIWLGLLAGLVACRDLDADRDPPYSVGLTDCTAANGQAQPPTDRVQTPLTWDPENPWSSADGRDSFLIRYRRTVSATSAAEVASDVVTRKGGQVKARWDRLGAVAARLTLEEYAAVTQDPDVLWIERDQ